MRALNLYGAWRAQWQNSDAPAAALQLQRHPELNDSVRGRVERDGITALLAGDVDDGDLTLEESRNGKRISATWIGRVVPESCGKEIRGTWTDADTEAKRDFVLRRQSGSEEAPRGVSAPGAWKAARTANTEIQLAMTWPPDRRIRQVAEGSKGGEHIANSLETSQPPRKAMGPNP